jgi:hypothetical protein
MSRDFLISNFSANNFSPSSNRYAKKGIRIIHNITGVIRFPQSTPRMINTDQESTVNQNWLTENLLVPNTLGSQDTGNCSEP